MEENKYEVSVRKNRDTVGVFLRCKKCHEMQCLVPKKADWDRFVISDYDYEQIPKIFKYFSVSQRNMLSSFICPLCAQKELGKLN